MAVSGIIITDSLNIDVGHHSLKQKLKYLFTAIVQVVIKNDWFSKEFAIIEN